MAIKIKTAITPQVKYNANLSVRRRRGTIIGGGKFTKHSVGFTTTTSSGIIAK